MRGTAHRTLLRLSLCCLLRGFLFFEPCANQRVVQPVIAFVTRMLEYRALAFHQRQLSRPGSAPHGWIVDREAVLDHIVGHAREPLDDAQVLARPRERILAVEVCGFYDERLALPAAARDPNPLTDRCRRLWAPVEGNNASVVDHRGENHDVPGSLHDLIIAVVPGVHHRRSRATHDEAAIIEFVGLGRIPAATELLASLFPLGGSLFSFVGQWRDSAVRWIEDQRRPQTP